MKKINQQIHFLISVVLACTGMVLCSSAFGEITNTKGACQWWEGPIVDQGCTGVVGLMRLSRGSTQLQAILRRSSTVLFGMPTLPSVGSEIALKRSAHLRRQYWPERDDQVVRFGDKICNQVGCRNTTVRRPSCGFAIGETARMSKGFNVRRNVTCPGPTEDTEYFSAGTVVRILGYQQMGQLFALVQVIKIESRDPEEDEKRYEFDRQEVI